MCPGQEYQRKLHPDDHPLRAQIQRTQRGEQCHFLVRKNPHYPRRKQILPPIIETSNSCHSLSNSDASSIVSSASSPTLRTPPNCAYSTPGSVDDTPCKMCKNNFKSCEFCNKSVVRKLSTRHSIGGVVGMNHSPRNGPNSTTYSPVYNIREIRTVCHSFSSLGIDKKLLEVERHNNRMNNAKKCNMRLSIAAPQLSVGGATVDHAGSVPASPPTGNIVMEVVHNNPAQGYGSFVYI